jgi:nitroreductase
VNALLSRRELLVAGVGAAALGSHAVPVRAAQSDPELNLPNRRAAYEPWYSWRANAPKSAAAIVHSAVLAANAHDTQPWMFRIDGDRIDVYADMERHLGAMDPFRREMHLSLGCALENAVLIARSLGYAANIELTSGSLREAASTRALHRVASIGLAGQSPDVSPLVAAIPHRHTNRSPYQGDRRISDETLHQLSALVGDAQARLIWITDPLARRDFASATVAATQNIVADSVMIADSDRWFRSTDAEIERHRDGPTLYCAGLSPLVLFGARLMPISAASAHRHWIDQTRDSQLGTNPVIGLIAVKDLYDRDQALRGGRFWQRLHLQGTLLGLGMQPLNQLPECVDRELQLGKPSTYAKTLAGFCGDSQWQPTFAFRVGWPTRPAPASPRRTLQSVFMPPSRADS